MNAKCCRIYLNIFLPIPVWIYTSSLNDKILILLYTEDILYNTMKSREWLYWIKRFYSVYSSAISRYLFLEFIAFSVILNRISGFHWEQSSQILSSLNLFFFNDGIDMSIYINQKFIVHKKLMHKLLIKSSSPSFLVISIFSGFVVLCIFSEQWLVW